MGRRWMVLPLAAWLAMGCALPENQYECALSACPEGWVCCPGTSRCASSAARCESAVEIEAGYSVDETSDQSFTCALTDGGRVACWGANEHGQLGDGTFVGRDYPSLVLEDLATSSPLSGVSAVALGDGFACAVREREGAATREIWCWGRNDGDIGQLGRSDSRLGDSSVAVHADALPARPYLGLAAGRRHACAFSQIDPGGTRNLHCWGNAVRAPEPDGSAEAESALTRVRSVFAARAHTCIIDLDGAVWCWGLDGHEQLGNGELAADDSIPRRVLNLSGAVRGSAGPYHTCAVDDAGTLSCWGRSLFGRLGDGSRGETHRSSASEVELPSPLEGERVSDVTCGRRHTCATTNLGRVFCWGRDSASELGPIQLGPDEDRLTPVLVRVGCSSGIVTIAAGFDHTCVIDGQGRTGCWGRGDPTPTFAGIDAEPMTECNGETTDDEG